MALRPARRTACCYGINEAPVADAQSGVSSDEIPVGIAIQIYASFDFALHVVSEASMTNQPDGRSA
jgi:hypothetical protein